MLFSSGSQMVMIFFVLSGFFMAMSMENNKVTGPKKLKIFYSTRFIRIYVPYISSIVVSVLVLFWVAKYTPDLYNLSSNREFNNRLIVAYHDITIQNFLKSLVFSKNNEYIGFNYAYWSLLYEGIFYLIIPFIHRIQRQTAHPSPTLPAVRVEFRHSVPGLESLVLSPALLPSMASTPPRRAEHRSKNLWRAF